MVKDSEIHIMSTGDPIQDLKWIVNSLHEEMPPVEVLGAMLCNVIDMLEGNPPEILAKNVEEVSLDEGGAFQGGSVVKKGDWH